MEIFRLIYFSGETRRLNPNELSDLLIESRGNNKEANITGILVYREGIYIQVLEGAEADVRKLYGEIRKDPRHTRILTISEEWATDREFASWSMAFRQSASDQSFLDEIPWPPPDSPPNTINSSAAAKALRAFMMATEDPLDYK